MSSCLVLNDDLLAGESPLVNDNFEESADGVGAKTNERHSYEGFSARQQDQKLTALMKYMQQKLVDDMI